MKVMFAGSVSPALLVEEIVETPIVLSVKVVVPVVFQVVIVTVDGEKEPLVGEGVIVTFDVAAAFRV